MNWALPVLASAQDGRSSGRSGVHQPVVALSVCRQEPRCCRSPSNLHPMELDRLDALQPARLCHVLTRQGEERAISGRHVGKVLRSLTRRVF